jgi:hypothetical protein
MALVYRHKKPSGETFYIGIGVVKKRAYSKHGRNKHWHNVVNKYGYEVEILTKDVDYETARELERILISYYGRKDLKKGFLVNMTDGGEGFLNMNYSERELRKNRMIDYNKNLKDYSFTQNQDYKYKMKIASLGRMSKKVINLETNEVFDSLRKASDFYRINYTSLSSMLNNKKNNNTNLQWQN